MLDTILTPLEHSTRLDLGENAVEVANFGHTGVRQGGRQRLLYCNSIVIDST